MALLDTVVAVALDGVAVALLAWVTWIAVQSRERPSAKPFIAVVGTFTCWALLTFVTEIPGTTDVPVLSSVLDLGSLLTGIAVPGIFTIYALAYTGRGTGLTIRRLLMLAGIGLPVVLAGGALAVAGSVEEVRLTLGTLIFFELFYLLALCIYATYLLLGLGRKHDRIATLQMPLLVVGVFGPYLGGILRDSGVADGLTIGFLVAGGCLVVGLQRYPLLTGFPRAEYVARNRVVGALQEGVVVVDWDDHIIDANARTAELFADSTGELIGRQIQSVVDGIEGRDLSAGATGTVTLQTTAGNRIFQYSVSAVDEMESYEPDGAGAIARAVLLRDVTDRQTREQRLAVLNRVLRHNVRNELDVILAHADHVDDEELRTPIRESASALVELSNKAREAEEIMDASADAPESVDLGDVVTTVADEYRDDDAEYEVTVSFPSELTVNTYRSVVRGILSELVDNALTHIDESTPRVEIGVRDPPDAAAELTVADNGPGIPERERALITDGTDTQLKHGQGMGLWFVNWAVTQLGGDLAFEENDPSGSAVTVRLYE